jgi:phospho-N-acetylmuramoyl-pentapeptide-transferase
MELLSINLTDIKFVFLLTSLSFIVAMVWTPLFTDFLFKNKLGKRIRQTTFDSAESAPIFYRLHKGKENTPTMGGLLIWITTAVITFSLNFDRAGTLYTIIAAIGAWWFYSKLGFSIFHIPGYGNIDLGWLYIPLFIAVLVWTAFSANQTDGLDGLAGGVMAVAFAAFAFIALFQGKVALAAFCGTIVGATMAFLWFNIHPARFFMGDTGIMPLGMTLAVIAFLTNSVFVLPIIAPVLMIEGLSTVIQIGSKKLRGKKVFLSAPIHHHFEALGWPETKVTQRFWVISAAFSVIGLFIALVGRG